MSNLFEPKIFKAYPSVRAALTLRGRGSTPYGFNMSLSVGDDPERVIAARRKVAARLGFDVDRLAVQQQVHGAVVRVVEEGYEPGESDALICAEPGRLLAVSVADCVPVLLYSPVRQVVAGVHSGWRGTVANITGVVIERLRSAFGVPADDLRAYVGASAGQCCYEVGADVAGEFDARHSRPLGAGKFLLDNRGAVLDQLLAAGLRPSHVELDARCTICDETFHSFRRDGAGSGRMFALIGMLG